MQFLRYRTKRGRYQLGVVKASGVFDLASGYEQYSRAGGAPIRGLADALRAGSLRRVLQVPESRAFLDVLSRAEIGVHLGPDYTSLDLGAPIHDPGRIIGVGLNYRSHAQEMGQALPTHPPLFAKWANSINVPYGDIKKSPQIQALDYEVELGVIMGRRACCIDPGDALPYVFGYTLVNDVSARDLQFQTSQWLAGKIGDGFAPLGPTVTEEADILSPQDLTLETWVNGQPRQRGHTSDMIFGVAALVSYLSHLLTLEPGDVIATGTPAGVGMSSKPPRYLQVGDVVRMSITGLGTIEHTIRPG